MKKLKKVKTTLQDSLEAYAGDCNCNPNCNCICICQNAIKAANIHDPTYDNAEFVGISTSLSSVHY